MNRFKVLAEAEAATKDREGDYGSPRKNFERIAAIWNVILAEKFGDDYDYEISAADVAMMMVAVKLARLIETPDHDDSAVDLAGYAALLGEIA